jgi:uncharacterized membrane protein
MGYISTISADTRLETHTVRRIGVPDVRAALAAGWADFLAIPTQLVFLCVLYPIVGLVAARAAVGTELMPLLFPLVAGIALLGPVLAIGVYELSRRREANLPVSWLNAFDVLRSPAIFSIAALGAFLLVVFTAWIGTARLIYVATLGTPPATAGAFVHAVLLTRAGWDMLIIGNVVGAVFSVIVLMLTVVSVPMMLDRNVSPIVAVRTSLRAVMLNPVPMALWGIIVGAALLAGSIPLFIGLAIAMPVLGHATWHLYRRLVA